MRIKTEIKAALFGAFLLSAFVALMLYSLSFWDGRLGIEDNGDGRIETLYLLNPLNEINPGAGDYYSE